MKRIIISAMLGFLIPNTAFAQTYGNSNLDMYSRSQGQSSYSQPVYIAPIAQAPQPPQYNQQTANSYQQNYLNNLPVQHVCTRAGNNTVICN